MQIVEKSAEGLSRVYGVTIAAALIATRTDAKIAELAPQLNIKGFRKGKVPVVHVKRMYGKSIMGDLLNELVQEGIESTVSNNGIRAASQPDVTNLGNLGDVMDGKADLTFDVELEKVSGTIKIVIPYSTLEPIKSKLSVGFQSEQLEVDFIWINRVKEQIMQTKHAPRPTAHIVTEFMRDGERYRAYDKTGRQLVRSTFDRDWLAARLGELGYNPVDGF